MATDLEKPGYGYATEQHEAKNVYSDVDSQDGYVEEFTPAEQKKIIHRIDRRLVTTVGLMYCISLMERDDMVWAFRPFPHRQGPAQCGVQIKKFKNLPRTST
ncbi:hypothetical protein B0A49_07862 [Cryomyces minteri]|uniref:Uncharacterized protein n=1 Tax=Cryomyces minteri TaxID=331657 RepID=A0A4U0WKY5_9PEZI|nr:hypothetical protein B0A49_07862 [Cryomyces minteri]